MFLPDIRSILGESQIAVLVGAVVQIDGRYLLVREAEASCRGKWSVPSGHLKPGESIPDGAIREVTEESGHSVRLTGLYPLVNCTSPYGTLILVPYKAKSLGVHAQPNPEEIIETGLFTRAEINAMRERNELRFPNLIDYLLDQAERGNVLPLDILQIYQ